MWVNYYFNPPRYTFVPKTPVSKFNKMLAIRKGDSCDAINMSSAGGFLPSVFTSCVTEQAQDPRGVMEVVLLACARLKHLQSSNYANEIAKLGRVL